MTASGTAWLIAITGTVTGIGALVMNRRGQREQNAQTAAANAIQKDKNRLEETEQAITSLEKALDRSEAEAERFRRLYEEALNSRDTERREHASEYREQERLCREYASDLTDAIRVLKRGAEPHMAAAADRVLAQPSHPHVPTMKEEEHDHVDGDVADLDGG